jgi:hypothetical protein
VGLGWTLAPGWQGGEVEGGGDKGGGGQGGSLMLSMTVESTIIL